MKMLRTLILCLLLPVLGVGQQSFSFHKTNIAPGTKAHFKIPVADGKHSTFIPITVFHGKNPGPTLGVTAGVHGYEYPPILAAQQLLQKIDPQELSGTVILVQLASVASFLGRSPYLNPIDGKNLNRSFPGRAAGSITERIAHIITKEVIARSDHFVDIHGGDSPEDLRPYNAWYHSDALPEASEKGKQMALAMGFDYSVIFNIPKERIESPSIYCSQEAFHRNIPAVDIECGRLGLPGEQETEQIVQGMLLLLSHLKMLPTSSSVSKKPTIIEERASVKSNSTGIFYSDKKAGDYVTKGEPIGYITDFFGEKLEAVSAPQKGMILYMIGTPPINKGETLLSIGLLP